MSQDTPVPVPAPPDPPAPSAPPAPPLPVLPPSPPTAAAPRRRRGRTTLLVACAAVLGVLAGGGLGYRVQQQRTPTPLPPLTGPVLAQPKGAGQAPDALPASQDRAAVYDGDLLTMLLPTPKGAKEEERDWEDLDDFAERFTKPAGAFVQFAGQDFRRAADASWVRDRTVVTVELAQFRDDVVAYAPQRITAQWEYNDANPELGDSHVLPGTTDGGVWGSDRKHQEAGYLPTYYGSGLARSGNIVVQVFVVSVHPVKAATVASLTTRQLERL